MPKINQKKREQLGRKIKRLRKAKDLTQEDLAFEVGISRTHMGHVEQGRRSPSLEVLQKIAKVCGVKVSDLIPY